jgi:glycogen debranching enzyme
MKTVLAGPLGIKTLDSRDWKYRGVYENGNQSSDPTVAHGFNYHQGPEWVWVHGYFLRAYLYFFTKAPGFKVHEQKMRVKEVEEMLKKPKEFIQDLERNKFAGLPELTNENGAFCVDSCETQAWSMAVFLELVKEMQQLKLK